MAQSGDSIDKQRDESTSLPVAYTTGRHTDDDFDFFGRYGDRSDGSRERYVNQQEVIDGELPSGKPATQQEIDGYIGEDYVYQERVNQGLTPKGKKANQDAVEGFLSKEPRPDLSGLSIPEIEMSLFSGKAKKHPSPPIGAPRMPGQKRRKRRR